MKKRRIFLLFLSIGILYLLVSCRDELFHFADNEQEVVKPTLTVEKAREVFERTMSGMKTRSDADSSKQGLFTGNFTPLWKDAVESADTLIESVDIPVTTQFIYRGTFRTDYTDNSQKSRRYMTYIYQKLLVMRNKKTGNTDCFIMNLIPTKEYYELHKNDVATQFLNSSEDINFSGIVLYSWLRDNSTVRIDVYKDGERVAAESIFNKRYNFEENHRRMGNLIAGARVFKFEKIKTRSGMEWVNFGGGETIWGGMLPEVEIPGHRPDPEFPENPDNPDPEDPDNPDGPDDPKPEVGGIPGGPANPEDPIDPSYSIKVQLSVAGSGTYTLLDEYTVSVTVTPAIKDPQVYYYMSKRGEKDWGGVEVSNSKIKARYPGVFDIQAQIYTDKGPQSSNIVQVVHQFPLRDEILKKAQTHFDDLWKRTLEAYSETSCREYACNIYVETWEGGKEGYTYEDIEGKETSPKATIITVSPKFGNETVDNFRQGGKFMVAGFHTHPPMKYAAEGRSSIAGPSDRDKDSIVSAKLPAFVYDYIGTPDKYNKYYIYSGDDIDKDVKIHPYGLERRPNDGF